MKTLNGNIMKNLKTVLAITLLNLFAITTTSAKTINFKTVNVADSSTNYHELSFIDNFHMEYKFRCLESLGLLQLKEILNSIADGLYISDLEVSEREQGVLIKFDYLNSDKPNNVHSYAFFSNSSCTVSKVDTFN